MHARGLADTQEDCLMNGRMLFMKYKVIHIEEDLDYGCEELPAGPLALVTLADEDGNQDKRKIPERTLTERKIEIGCSVIFDEAGEIRLALDGDWTKNCTSETVDLAAFADLIQRAESGEEISWRCPFCGGEVGLLEKESGHSVIGCRSCDMRITLDH